MIAKFSPFAFVNIFVLYSSATLTQLNAVYLSRDSSEDVWTGCGFEEGVRVGGDYA
jgi:hypothetical protein